MIRTKTKPGIARSKTARPETSGQADRWGAIKAHYLRLGLCHKCAAQAAYGSQLGFSNVNPPCAGCAPVVSTFESDRPNGWRSTGRVSGGFSTS